MTPRGLTATAGWQAGVRRTFPVALEDAWALLSSREGLELWLGGPIDLEPGRRYELPDGTHGEVRALSDRHVRLTWSPPDWTGESTIQVRVLPAARRTTISFHHERLADAGERERALERWRAVLDVLAGRLVGPDAPA